MSRDTKLAEKILYWETERNLIIDVRATAKSHLVKRYLEELTIHIWDVITDLNEIKNEK